MSDKHVFDTLIVTTPDDFRRVSIHLPRISANITNGRLIFIGRSEVGSLVRDNLDSSKFSFINENEIVPFDDVHALFCKRLESIAQGQEIPRRLTGWYYQQFLKMKYAYICDNEYYMTWDGDTIPCKKVEMFDPITDQPYFDLKHEHHKPYFETLSVILPGMSKIIEQSFISEHMIFKCEFMKELVDAIEGNTNIEGTLFWEKILNAIPPEDIQNSAFSEFETYGTFVSLRHVNFYKPHEWHSFRYGASFFDPKKISDSDYEWLSKDFGAITFEKNQTVREDHKNLFDNKEYQSKLSARQMLEIAQEDFEGDSYIEKWGE